MIPSPLHFLFVITAYNVRVFLADLIESIARQRWQHWSAVFIDDCSTDGTPAALRELLAAQNLMDHFTVLQNDQRRHRARNLFEAIRAHPRQDDVIVIVDGDDRLATPDVLDRLAREYQQGWDIVWSNWRSSDGSRGTSAHLHPFLSVRRQPFVSSHLFSFRRSLFSAVVEADLQDDEGRWFEAGSDVALAWPLLEQTIKRKFIADALYVYNRANPLSHDKLHPGDRPYVSPLQARTSAILRQRPGREVAVDHNFLQAHLYELLQAAAESARLMTRLEIAAALAARAPG